jgi:FAD/FMN-containing dehydrogenase
VARRVEPEERAGRSYRIFGNVRNMRFNEMEYTVPAEKGPACLAEILATIQRENLDVIFPIEYRYVKADDIWLSPFYQRNGCTISCHNFHDRDYKKYFAAIEPIFWKHEGRPHPGKIHTLGSQQLARLYPRWNDFLRARVELDPQGRFLNDHLRKIFGVPE